MTVFNSSLGELYYPPRPVDLHWSDSPTGAVAHDLRSGASGAVVAEIVVGDEHYSAFWLGPNRLSGYALWVGDFGSTAVAMATLEEYASRVVLSL